MALRTLKAEFPHLTKSLKASFMEALASIIKIDNPLEVLIFGASGSGTTTLGKALADTTHYSHLDADDFYWKPTTPPYKEKFSPNVRQRYLRKAFTQHKNVIVSGSLVNWGQEWLYAFDLTVFISMDDKLRMDRLLKREHARYGDLLIKDKEVQRISDEFLAYASEYENPDFKGRTRKIHLEWMKKLNCAVLRINGSLELEEKKRLVIQSLD